MIEVESIPSRLEAVRTRMADACRRAGRPPESVTIVAVCKTMPAERVQAAYAAGQRQFGENRIQEAVPKIEALALPDAAWHLIGHLQSNKAKFAARHFAVVQSIDSTRIAEALSKETEKTGRPIDVMLEVNYAGEASKFGFSADETLDAAMEVARLPRLRVAGLMTVAPQVVDPEEVRPVFRGMRELGDRVRAALPDGPTWDLSMGMTNDYAVAIEEGATIVRVGRAIFGERPAP
jgi:pyridoxal phosphate enzyme (YggS family)